MESTECILIDFEHEGFEKIIKVTQFDTGKIVRCHIKGISGDVGLAMVYCRKPSGLETYTSADVVDDHTVEFAITKQMNAEIGEVKCQLQLFGDDKSLTSYPFKILVRENMIADSRVTSTDEYTAFIDTVSKLTGAHSELSDKIESEKVERVSADAAEKADRVSADEAEKSERQAADAVEKAERMQEIAVERARINNLVANNNPTEGNSELLDIRVGVDGTDYGSAGDAVRGQIGSLYEDIENLYNLYDPLIETMYNTLLEKTGSVPINKLWICATPLKKNSILENIYLVDRSGLQGKIYLFKKNETTYSLIRSIDFTSGNNGDIKNINFFVDSDNIYIGFLSTTENGIVNYAFGDADFGAIELNPSTYELVADYSTQIDLFFRCEYITNKEYKRTIHVCQDGTCGFKTINEALNYAYKSENINNQITIVIHPGIYDESLIVKGNHYISLIGINRVTCIVRDRSGLYDKSPIRINGNILVKNLTIIADLSNYQSIWGSGTGKSAWVTDVLAGKTNPSWLDSIGSYAVHCDDETVNDGIKKTCRFENCYMFSESFPAFGGGMQPNQMIEIDGCILETNFNYDVYKLGKGQTQGTLLCHGKFGDNKENQGITVKNTIIKTNIGKCITLYPENPDDVAELNFYNNICITGELIDGEQIVDNRFNIGVSKSSFGNNVEQLTGRK